MYDIVVAYLILSRNGEESFNKSLSPDPDPNDLRGPSHGYNTLCRRITPNGAIVFELLAQLDRQTDPSAFDFNQM